MATQRKTPAQRRSASRRSTSSSLGELERAVMEVLWSLEEGVQITVREVHGLLAAERDVAYTTVMTVMDRLARKGLTHQQKEGRAYLYRAATSRAAMTAELMRDTLADLGSGDRGPALVAFVEDASPDELDALRRALDGLKS